MHANDVLIELYGRVSGHVDRAVADLDAAQLVETIAPGTNPVGWLVWHLTRVLDHSTQLWGRDQVWVEGDWAEGFGLTADPDNTGYGHSSEEVASVRPTSPDALVGYFTAVSERVMSLLESTTDVELEAVIDEDWDPPVTLGVRLVSVADDCIQHAGQAAYLRGILVAD